MQKAYIYPNKSKPRSAQVVRSLIDYLQSAGFESYMSVQHADVAAGVDGVTFITEAAAYKTCDFVIVIGGDGTILSVAKRAARADIPILGINVGHLGFMTELEPTELEHISRIKTGDYTLDKRLMLSIGVINDTGKRVFSTEILNDASVMKGIVSKGARLSVFVDDKETIDFYGDGVIVCTPTGSTAYSLSAGGPIIEPSSQCIAVTPICPHSLSIKSFVVSSDREISILPEYIGQKMYLSQDGFEPYKLKPGERVVIKRAPNTVSLIRLKGLGFYEIIKQKLSGEKERV